MLFKVFLILILFKLFKNVLKHLNNIEKDFYNKDYLIKLLFIELYLIKQNHQFQMAFCLYQD